MVYNIFADDNYGTVVGAIREEEWKYIRMAKSETEHTESLFNIEADFKETTDLSKTQRNMTLYMRSLFDEMSSSMVPGIQPEPFNDTVHVDEMGYVKTGWCDV